MALKIPESYRAMAKVARSQGWVIQSTGSGHLAWIDPQGHKTFTPSSPSCKGGSGIIRIKAKLRKAGLKI